MSFTGCDFISGILSSEDRKVVASCFDKKLYQEDIETIVPGHFSKEDSSMRVNAYINEWIAQSTLVHFALEDTLVDLDKVNKKVEDYKDQLLSHAYQKALIKQNLDTTVSEEEIKAYYDEHKNNYKLSTPAIKGIYFSFYRKQASLPDVEKWFYSNQEGALDSLIKHGKAIAQQQFTNPDQWHYWKNIARQTPLENINTEDVVKENDVLKESDDNNVHYVKLIEAKGKGEYTPLPLVKDQIKHQILTERKNKLLHSYKDSFLEKAHEKNAVKISD